METFVDPLAEGEHRVEVRTRLTTRGGHPGVGCLTELSPEGIGVNELAEAVGQKAGPPNSLSDVGAWLVPRLT